MALPEEKFLTIAPDDCQILISKEKAVVKEISSGLVSTDSLSLHGHILFELPGGAVLIGWSSEDNTSETSQASLFSDLEIGGDLPKLPAEVYAIRSSYPKQTEMKTGYHVAYTQKNDMFYKWSLSVSQQPFADQLQMEYELLHRYNPASRKVKAKLSLALPALIRIENQYDFNRLVQAAMAELSETGQAPEYITYDFVMNLAKELEAVQ